MTPSLLFTYQPDFSKKEFGGNNYFQKLDDGSYFDYFSDSYVGKTFNEEKQTYRFRLNNDFQIKVKNPKKDYSKYNLLNISSSFYYSSLKKEFKFSDLKSSIRARDFSGKELFTIQMAHDLYKKQNDERLDQMINFLSNEFPRLKYIHIRTNINLNLFGNNNLDFKETQINNEENKSFQNIGDINSNLKKNSDNIWESNLRFNYSANWEEINKNWDYRFTLKSSHKIKLSQKWSLFYEAHFNIKEREMTYHMFRFYRPLHCWEFSFNYFPKGISSGFSLQINVKNQDLRDLKLTSKSSNRGFLN